MKMTRRLLLELPLAALCRAADPAQEAIDLITELAASLSAGNVSKFLAVFDPKMSGYAELRQNVTALIAQGDVQCFIDPEENEGDGQSRALQLQWTLRAERSREQLVKCQVDKQSGKWRITKFEPLTLFAPF
jgi:murein L,D-transpeptidase YcbB/YkuD